MDFFTAQDNARRKTGRLVVLMVLAVLALIVVTTLAIAITLHLMGEQSATQTNLPTPGLWSALSIELVIGVAIAVLAVVVLGGLFKRSQLRRGGRVVAEALGGREINLNTRDADERRILNVVEEMAIASGTPVPPVYVLEEESINAFAAGYQTNDAVIGITRGTIRDLTRDELQGVVAHEFSHILHGDMRLNMRLISTLHGILLIGLLGSTILRSIRFRRVGGGKRDNSVAVILALGAALMLIGYAGTFFGNLIKSAVSRQREYLADASAVQFTRNPQGIGNALVKIGSHTQGSRLQAAQAAEFSHLFFGPGVRLGFIRMMATHPPLNDRIKRVMPTWNGRFEATLPSQQEQNASSASGQATARVEPGSRSATLASALTGASAQAAINSMGQPNQRHLAQARATLKALPERIKNAAHEPYAARALMYALLLSQNKEMRKQQLRALQQVALLDVYRELVEYGPEVLKLDVQLRLPLIELALPALKSQSREQVQHFRLCMEHLINAYGQVSLLEWTLYQLVLNNLSKPDNGPANLKLNDLQRECQMLLSVLAAAGQDAPVEINAAISAAESELPFSLTATDVSDMRALSLAVDRLRRLRHMQKPALLKAMARCIEHSGVIRPAEAELFRAVADILDCPMPPLLIEQS
ncbi:MULTISPECIES: M48 family metallopeptidase [unclassified Halomonas]|uniref:M48 family metallopeptidase n=1 Tax=unclassified Halomonas TaxID=2609666 RepID=UPI0007D99AC7|nr:MULTISPECIES: M48 family metallopeptidase [unclassified Halomonas]MBT2788221.1 M48 family metallopeptidase [Halomonas sp. ISL-106]MBT2795970.1 M48 family metallopeptidase [Halomonas sp. ISL-104]OAL61243.1 peptidase [Halomonas sp. ALS9]